MTVGEGSFAGNVLRLPSKYPSGSRTHPAISDRSVAPNPALPHAERTDENLQLILASPGEQIPLRIYRIHNLLRRIETPIYCSTNSGRCHCEEGFLPRNPHAISSMFLILLMLVSY